MRKKLKDTFDDRQPVQPAQLGAPRLAVRFALDPEGSL